MMEEEFYSSLKLTSGEEVFALVSVDMDEDVVILQDPVIIKFIDAGIGQVIKIKPWMEIPEDDFYIIRSDKIITMTEIKDDKIIEIYHKYLESKDSSFKTFNKKSESHKVEITDKMGYLSSVEEARKKLEDLFKDIKES